MDASIDDTIKSIIIQSTIQIINQRNKAEAAFQQHKQKLHSLMSDPRLAPVIRPLYDAMESYPASLGQDALHDWLLPLSRNGSNVRTTSN